MNQRTRCSLLSIIVAFQLGCVGSVALAGKCESSKPFYLAQLEVAKRTADAPRVAESLDCLTIALSLFELDRDSFASLEKLESYRYERGSSEAQAKTVLIPLTVDKDPKIACDAAKALALYEVSAAFEPLRDRCPDTVEKALAFGLIGDERAVPWLIAGYQKLGEKYAKKPSLGNAFRLSYLNALYFIASAKSLDFIEEIIKKPPSPQIARVAKSVRARILARSKQKKP